MLTRCLSSCSIPPRNHKGQKEQEATKARKATKSTETKKESSLKKKGLKQMVLKLGNVRNMQLLVMVICCNGNGHLFPRVSKETATAALF